LTIYQCKPNKNVMLISTQHEEATVQSIATPHPKRKQQHFKPNTVLTYNTTKVGVDSVDQMGRCYTAQTKSRRWPVHAWANVLNLASINAWNIYKLVNKSKISRRKFLIMLIDEIREMVKGRRGKAPAHPLGPAPVPKRHHCQLRLNCDNNKAIGACISCEKSVCGQCTEVKKFVCISCFEPTEQ
jgi:transposase IS4-like protein